MPPKFKETATQFKNDFDSSRLAAEKDLQDIRDALVHLEQFCAFLHSAKPKWEIAAGEVHRGNLAFGDINHLIELLEQTGRTENTRIVNLNRTVAQARRAAKRVRVAYDPLITLLEKSPQILTHMQQLQSDIKRGLNMVDSNHWYAPRVLHDLFSEVREIQLSETTPEQMAQRQETAAKAFVQSRCSTLPPKKPRTNLDSSIKQFLSTSKKNRKRKYA